MDQKRSGDAAGRSGRSSPRTRASADPRRAHYGSAFALDRAKDAPPLVEQLVRVISTDVSRGVLRGGDLLPGSRTLAERAGVHRNTMLAALRDLERQGWLVTQRARGTFVSASLPSRAARVAPREARAGFPVLGDAPTPPTAPREGDLPLLGGIPDLARVPTAAIARAYRRALARREVLGYGDPRGESVLRDALAALLRGSRAVPADAERVLVTRGSQMALYLAARGLVAPGDVVAVEAFGYRPAWDALTAAGATLVPVPVDGEGLDVAALAALASRRPLRAVYLTPHHQYPTTVTLSGPRRAALVELARAARLALLEDDYDHEFHYEGRPRAPLAANAPDVTVYVGTLSKVFAPGLRLGWVVAPEPLASRLAALRATLDRQGDRVQERAFAELLESGEVTRHVLRMRRVYRARRDHFVALLGSRFAGALSFTVPEGGMSIWAALTGVDADALASRAEARHVLVQPGRRFTFDGLPSAHLRLGYGALDEARLTLAVDRLAAAAKELRRGER